MSDHVDRLLEQWRQQRPDLDPAPMGVIGRIMRAARALERELQTTFNAYDLQAGEFDVLATLRRSGPPYQLTAGALVATSMVTSGAITHRVDRLVGKGLVTRATDPENRRTVRVSLTDAGRKLVDEAVAHHLDNERRLLTPLTESEQEQLASLLRRLLVERESSPEP